MTLVTTRPAPLATDAPGSPQPSSVMSTTSSTTLSSVPVMLAMVDRRGALSLFKNAMKNVLYRKNGASTNT